MALQTHYLYEGKFITSGSHQDYCLGQWVNQVSSTDPLTTLPPTLAHLKLTTQFETHICQELDLT